jgi:hypothetical protein
MKKLALLSFLSLTTLTAFGAQVVTCTGDNGDKVTLKRYVGTYEAEKRKDWFTIDINESLVCRYLGEVEGRLLDPYKSETADVLGDWDGNSGIKISMRKGFLNSDIGAISKAFLKVNYNDIAEDAVSHVLKCEVTE